MSKEGQSWFHVLRDLSLRPALFVFDAWICEEMITIVKILERRNWLGPCMTSLRGRAWIIHVVTCGGNKVASLVHASAMLVYCPPVCIGGGCG